MADQPSRAYETSLAPGARVRVRSRSPLVDLQSDMGTVVHKDEWADYYLVRLDWPARFHDGEGTPSEKLSVIRVDADDLETPPSVLVVFYTLAGTVNHWAASLPPHVWSRAETPRR